MTKPAPDPLTRFTLGVVAALGVWSCGARSAPAVSPLALERTIPLVGVQGRIDHLAFDAGRWRLFVAELGNGSVEALDVRTGRSLARINGLSEPQGLAYIPGRDELAVATGGDGMLRFYRAADLTLAGSLKLGDDADNVRLEPANGRVVVGYGDGALAIVDPASRRIVGTVPLPAHPEGFQVAGARAYVNVPDAGRTVVADMKTGQLLKTWPNGWMKFNFPLALTDTGDVAAGYRLPGMLTIVDRSSGARRQALTTCGDTDDVLVDRARGRLYVTCGSGSLDVFQKDPAGYRRLERIRSRNGARTGLFAPELDRLFVAARASENQPAAILVFRPLP